MQQYIGNLDAVTARLEAANIKVIISKTRLTQTKVFVMVHTFSAAESAPILTASRI